LICGWFGDATETMTEPLPQTEVVREVLELLGEYRNACRVELQGEALATLNNNLTDALRNAKITQQMVVPIVQLFLELLNNRELQT
jgi:hypothetical protein